MTTPNLTPDGHLRRAPRDWLESLCERQPDGTWLVQPPPLQDSYPQFRLLPHLLPDDRRKDKYVAQATRLMRADVAVHITSTPAASLPAFWMITSPILPFASFVADVLMVLVAMVAALLLPSMARFVQSQRRSRLVAWLDDVASTPGNGSTATPMTVRTAQDWEAVVESNGWRGQRILALGMISLTLLILAGAAAAHLNSCLGVAMLDPLFPERAREQVSAGRNCAFHSQMLLLTIGAVLSVAGLDMRASRRRRAETARAVPVDRAA